MSRVHVRPMRPDDHEVVGRLLVAAYDAVGRFDDRYRSHLGDPSGWAADASAALVAVAADDVPIGCVAFVLPGDPAFEPIRPVAGDAGFRFLAVAPEAQGAGAGEALVRACIDRARDAGARRMVIHSMAFMTAAHRLYERLGFVHRHDLDVVFPGGLGYGLTLDLVVDAQDHFPAPGPVPDRAPWFEDAWGLREPRTPTC